MERYVALAELKRHVKNGWMRSRSFVELRLIVCKGKLPDKILLNG